MRFDGGWIKLHRSLGEHWIGKNVTTLGIFTKLVLLSNYKPSKIRFNGKLVELARGQILTSSIELAENSDLSRSTIERHLKRLQDDGSIEQLTSSHGRIITICNYERYQQKDDLPEQQPDNQRTASDTPSGQPADNQRTHSKEVNKSIKKEVKNLIHSEASPARLLIATYCEAYKAKYTTNPVIDGRASGTAVRILKDVPLEKAQNLIKCYLEMNDQWFITRGHDLITFEQNLNKVEVFAQTGKRVSFEMAKRVDNAQSNRSAFEAAAIKYSQSKETP